MFHQPRPTGRSTALSLWQQWSAIVRRFALRRVSRHRVRDDEYRELHRALLATLRQEAAAEVAEEGKAWRAMAKLARPWVSVESLAQADPDILLQTLHNAGDLPRGLDAGCKTGPNRWPARCRSAWLWGAAAAMGAMLLAAVSNPDAGIGFALRSTTRSWVNGVACSSPEHRLLMAGAVAMTVSVFVVYLSAGRSPKC